MYASVVAAAKAQQDFHILLQIDLGASPVWNIIVATGIMVKRKQHFP